MEDSIDYEEEWTKNPLKVVLTFLPQHKLPKTRSINVKSSYSSSLGNEITNDIIEEIDIVRERLCTELNGTSICNPRNVINILDEYLPLIYKLKNSLDITNNIIIIDKPLKFYWNSSFDIFDSNGKEYESLYYEISMCLITKALSHCNLARNIILDTNNMVYPNAVKQLCIAKGIMDYLSTNFLIRWESAPSFSDRPVEITPPFANLLSLYFHSLANQLAIAKSIRSGNINYSILARICFGISNAAERIPSVLQTDLPSHRPRIDIPWLKYIYFLKNFYYGIGFRFLATSEMEKGEIGIAIGRLRDCKKYFTKHQSFMQADLPGIPFLENTLSPLQEAIPKVVQSINKLEEDYQKDNNLVYFMSVPEEEYMPVEPSPHLILQATEFEEPVLDEALLFEHRERSDSEIARELQEKINKGEDI